MIQIHFFYGFFTALLSLVGVYFLFDKIKGNKLNNLRLSNYVTVVNTVPETHADLVREAMGKAGAGKFGNYSFCSFSVRGTGRFMPNEHAKQHIGTAHKLETVVEERIECVCALENLEAVIAAIKKVHPYETTVIDIYPSYELGVKLTR